MSLFRIAPELPAVDLGEALDYYTHKLGFHVAPQMPDLDYAIVERNGAAIHLFQDSKRAHSPVAIHIFTGQLDGLHEELTARGASITQPIMLKPWGNRDFRVRDPSGNDLKFTDRHIDA